MEMSGSRHSNTPGLCSVPQIPHTAQWQGKKLGDTNQKAIREPHKYPLRALEAHKHLSTNNPGFVQVFRILQPALEPGPGMAWKISKCM